MKRIFILLVVSLTIMAGSAFVYVFSDTHRDQINDIKSITKVIQSYYELSFHQWELSLLSVGNRLTEIDDPVDRLKYANTALEVYQNELLAFGFADDEGKVITFTGRLVNDSLPHLMKSEVTRRSFEKALANEGLSLGESYYFENVSDWILPVRVPIRDDEGNIVAVNTSAIAYGTMMAELDKFNIPDRYRIHLINNDFNTTQLYYPLSKDAYTGILGSDTLTYTEVDTISIRDGVYALSGMDPFSAEKLLMVCVNILPVNHRLIISIKQSKLNEEVWSRFKPVTIIYLLLVFASILLYRYVKRNLSHSIDQLQSERANLKAIIESTSSLIGLFDRNRHLMEFNQAFNSSTKRTDGFELTKGMDVLESMQNPDYAAVFRGFMDKVLQGEKFQEEVEYPGNEGSIFFRFNYNPVYNDEQVVGFSFFAEDITEIRTYQKQLESYSKDLEQKVEERTKELKDKNKELEEGYQKLKQAQQQLIRAEKMASLGILSAGIGHEINNPLNFIKHGAEALKKHIPDEKLDFDIEPYFDAIDKGVDRASKIVSGLSHFSRVGEAMDEDCDIHEILKNSLTMLTNRFRSKEIDIETNFKASKHTMKGNEGKLHQIFTNIINNAEQAIDLKGVINITTKNEGTHIIVEISDSGMGMSDQIIKQMTDPFFTTKDPGEGTGLGLFTTQMIIDEHEGEMKVESIEGQGTTFTLLFKVD